MDSRALYQLNYLGAVFRGLRVDDNRRKMALSAIRRRTKALGCASVPECTLSETCAAYDLDVESERGLAVLLAETLRDDGFWAALERPADDARYRLGERAVELYEATSPVIEERRGRDPARVDRALGALREIADAASIQSYPWTESEIRDWEVQFPRRDVIELLIRLDELDTWAGGFGQSLDLRYTGVPEVWPGDREPQRPDAEARDLAADVMQALSVYESWWRAQGLPEARAYLESAESRRYPCGLISSARGCLAWTRGHLPTQAEPAVLAMLFIAQGAFVASHRLGAETFPSEALLRSLLLDGGGFEWLQAEGFDPPDWLVEG